MTRSTTPTPPRRGRPVAADAEHQRRRLLHIAAEVFAEFGPDATRLQQIAERAGVDRRLLYHYFQSKDNLYLEVLSDHYRRLGEIANRIIPDTDSVARFMELLMRALFAYCRENPDFVRALAWENLRGARGFTAMKPLAIEATMLTRLRPLLAREIELGRCRRDLDPKRLLVSGLAHCLYVFANRHSLQLVLHFDTSDDAALDAWIDHAVSQVIHGIQP